jgi:hypothetical protein
MDIATKYIFLLGGHDLEMTEIRNILEQHQIAYRDNNLAWGAKLSSYKDEFDDEHIYVGVELIADCKLPKHYLEIDHHNTKSNLPSSIEQVANLLGIELNRRHNLIAANDKGYIPAMIAMQATPDEIETIRILDRKAQGVTAIDEQLGERSIQQNRCDEKGVIIIQSLTSKFSVIADRLFPSNKLLIYSDHELTYYGKGVSLLIQEFENLITKKIAFYGGGIDGFFGIVHGYLSCGELKELKSRIVEIITADKK